MFSYIARQAIFDREKQVYAYELLFRDGESNCFPDIAPDEATSKLLTGSQLATGVEEITNGKPAFINFHQDTLLYRFPTFLDPMNVVIEVVESVHVDAKLESACRHIKDLGYRIALDDFDFDPKWQNLLQYAHIVKFDLSQGDFDNLIEHMPLFKKSGIKLVAERIETYEDFDKCMEAGFDYFQGYFFARPEVVKSKNIPTSKLSLIELMNASNQLNFDFDAINQIIERDVALSYMLLRFINNPMVNKRFEITSLKHALKFMGEVEVKKFVALLALANLSDEKPAELVQLSLVRAKFCELLSVSLGEAENPPKGFLVGLFSLLDALLDQQMSNLMQKLPISDDLKNALCGDKSTLRTYLSVIMAIEQGNWQKLQPLTAQLNVDENLLHSFYNEAIKWAQSMTKSINAPR